MLTVAALVCVAVLLGVGVFGVIASRMEEASRLVYGCSLVVCLALLAVAAAGLTAGGGTEINLPLGLPLVGAHFRIDPLSAFFLAVVDLGGAAASLYALGYGEHEATPWRVLPFFPAFLAGMNLTVLAADAFSFLLAWEFMSLSSWALVNTRHQDAENTRAGYIYLVMASFGTLSLLLAFGLLAGPTGGYAFQVIREATHPAWMPGLVLVLALLGAGSKAGLVPLHVWLPLAHPAAPSHVSALMSGVMTKVAVYGFIRIVFDLLGPPAWWWSILVLVLAGVTAVMGVLYALMQHDLKRLLAYHTVENIGIIFIGLGLSLAFRAHGMAAAAALALTAGLFHVFNHSLFKSLLFFGAGAVQTATGERDMEHLGGLIHRMPQTAFAFLVGCVAISALPPLNGFVSEWLTFQAILLSPQLPSWVLKFIVPVVGALLALSASLAAACFVKAFGVTFLGRARTPAAERASETDPWSRATMFGFAGLCFLAGILPGFVIDGIGPATQQLVGEPMPVQAGTPWLSIVPVAASRSSYNGLLVFLFIAVSALFAARFIHRFGSHALRRGPPWDCGFPDPSPATQYTASSFAQPIRRVFGPAAFRARERLDMPPPGDMRPARLSIELTDRAWHGIYAPVTHAVETTALKLNRFQFLTIRQYLSVVFVALVALLVVVAIWQ
ncbi:MAG: hydrogenase 4 subunit B [Methylobacteriaceae bacterium]|nr:hydrogenase 4 subunit B [Methylobacteriaceae bacterium]